MPDSPNREAARDALATLIDASMGPAGDGAVTEVLNYSTVDLQGRTPVVMVFADGTNRSKREGFGPDSYFATEARLRIALFVALPSPTDTAYTHQDAEDKLDLIDKRIADVVIASDSAAQWKALRYEPGFSQPTDVELPGGHRYIMETFSLIAKLR